MGATRHHTQAATLPRPARALTAAARKIDITSRSGRKQLRKAERWQSEAWAYYDALSLVGFSINFFGNSCSRLRTFPAILVDFDDAPVSLAVAAENDPALAQLAADAAEELARIDNDSGGWPSIFRGLTQNVACVGETYLVCEPVDGDEDPLRDEHWGAYSVDSVRKRGERTVVYDDENDKQGRPLPDDALVYRIWRPHPRWPRMPHSNMRSVLADCEELLIYSRSFRATAKSRAHAGGLTWPSELSMAGGRRSLPDGSGVTPGGDPDDVTGAPQALEDLADAMTTAIEEDDSVAQVAPTLIEGAYQYLDRINLIDLARDIDPKSLERVEQLVENFAHGVDLPTEIVTGKAASNHWTAWAIDDDTYKAHVEPLAAAIVGGVCSAVLQPALLEKGHAPELVARVRLGLDPSALTTRPNRTQDAKDLWDRWAISNDALRRYADFPESDAPSDDELLRRLALNRGIGSVGLTGLLLEEVGLLSEVDSDRLLARGNEDQPAEDNPSGDQGRGEEGGDPVPEPPQVAAAALRALLPRPPAAIVAADDGTAAVLAGVGAALAAIETRVRDRLVIAASAAVTDALRVAGQRLRRAVQGDPSLRDRVNGIPANEVGLVLGPAALDAVDADTLLDGAFVTLGEQWDTWVAAAQADIARQLERLPAGPVAAGAVIAGYTGPAEQDRAAGWAVLAAAVASLTRERLFAAGPSIVDGEHDPSTLVPAGMVRDALAQTGGSTAGLLPSGPAARSGPGGLTTGPRVLAVIGQLGVRVAGWRWTVGMPAFPFEPHQQLAGVVFTEWDDPVLANTAGWPPVPFFSPGDHVGCQCDAVMQLVALPGAMETRADAA